MARRELSEIFALAEIIASFGKAVPELKNYFGLANFSAFALAILDSTLLKADLCFAKADFALL